MNRAVPHSQLRRAFTLLELVLSVVILSVILIGAQSAMLIAANAAPDSTSRPARQIAVHRALELLASDLKYAVDITTLSAAEVIFTVADRNGDGENETIRYAWAGHSGAPLLRQINGSDEMILIDAVENLQFKFDITQEKLPLTYSEGEELLLHQYTHSLFPGPVSVRANNWVALFVEPTLPAGTHAWRITRVLVRARQSGGTSGETLVQVRLPYNKSPSQVVLDQSRLYEKSLASSFRWHEVSFTNGGDLPPSGGACIVFQWANDSESCAIERSLSRNLFSSNMLTTSNNGLSWSSQAPYQMLHSVYGKFKTKDPEAVRRRLDVVHCRLRSGRSAANDINMAIHLANRPEAPSP